MTRQHGTRGRAIAVGSLACCVLLGFSSVAIADDVGKLTDQAITDRIEDELTIDPSVEAHRIDVSTYEGIATLKGTVANLLARDRAAEIAETVRGVRGTVNLLKVQESYETDPELKEDVTLALLRDPVTEAFEISVGMHDGIATLTGEVDSLPEKRIAGRVAKGVRGLEGLNNELQIRLLTDRSDREIRQDIIGALRWDALIDGSLIGVKVDHGKVTLSGAVGSAAEKSRAAFKAFVAGVRSVDTKQLDVVGWARDPKMRRHKYAGFTDEQVAKAVHDGFFYDPRVLSTAVEVDVDDGVATLRGTVGNLKARRSAAQTARNTVGVRRVRNRIKVRPTKVRDALVEERVREAMIRDPYVSPFEVHVQANHGMVTLSGQVDSAFERAQADDAASRVAGVMFVVNDLTVDHDYPILTYDPYVDYDWYLFDRDWYSPPVILGTTKSDAAIKEDIQDELWWSPFVDSEDVIVSVKDGVATLKGSVSTYGEWQSALENAREGGAIAIKDRLKIVEAEKLAEDAK